MYRTATQPRPGLYLLADHLDTVLACGEDLVAVPPLQPTGLDDVAGAADIYRAAEARRAFVETVRTLELRIVAHVLKARDNAEDVRRNHADFKLVADLFVSGTAIVADAAADLGDATSIDFQTGDDTTSYLRSRGLIAADRPGVAIGSGVAIGEDFLVAGSLPLGALLDLVATFLDVLDRAFDLYGEASAVSAGAEAPAALPVVVTAAATASAAGAAGTAG